MVRALIIAASLVGLATLPAFADAKDDALAACSKELKRSYGISSAVSAKFRISGSGERFSVDGTASYEGRDGVRVNCKTNKGRVTAIVWS